MEHPFKIKFDELPGELNIFPLAGALLLPRGRLPLNIFEARYVNMVIDSLREQRLIGMVQTIQNTDDIVPNNAPFFNIGCAGKIVSFSETDDGRIILTLEGVCRFNVTSECEMRNGYRRIRSDFAPYSIDMDEPPECLDRRSFEILLKNYFKIEKIRVDWDLIEKTEAKLLIANLAMMCPFNNQEKQALLEARDFTHMTEIMTSLMEMAIRSCDASSVKH